jgi:hypothetical protein
LTSKLDQSEAINAELDHKLSQAAQQISYLEQEKEVISTRLERYNAMKPEIEEKIRKVKNRKFIELICTVATRKR